MATIPEGTYLMGDTTGENVEALPVHSVFISSFHMDRFEVTKELWDEVYQWAAGHGYAFDNPGLSRAANHPVHSINWYDAVKWCNARSEMENQAPAYYSNSGQSQVYRAGRIVPYVKWDSGYRLPTEAEWERAARGGVDGHRFPWLDAETITHARANYESREGIPYDVSPTRGYHPAFSVGALPFTSPVGSFPANGFGLYDMAGNVSEWCWEPGENYSENPQVNPEGGGLLLYRAYRGGSWAGAAHHCEVSGRGGYKGPTERDDSQGFRAVLPRGPR